MHLVQKSASWLVSLMSFGMPPGSSALGCDAFIGLIHACGHIDHSKFELRFPARTFNDCAGGADSVLMEMSLYLHG